MRPKIGTVFKDGVPHAKVEGSWKKAKQSWIKVDGTWKEFYRELEVLIASVTNRNIDQYEDQQLVTLSLSGTYGGSVSVIRVSGNAAVQFSRSSDTSWGFYASGYPGTASATFRFFYKNAIEETYVDRTVTVRKEQPPPPPPPPDPEPPVGGGGGGGGGSSGSSVIVNFPSSNTWGTSSISYTITNGTPGATWQRTVTWPGGSPSTTQGSPPLNGSGGATATFGDNFVAGLWTYTWTFSDGQRVTKYLKVPYNVSAWKNEFRRQDANDWLLSSLINLYRTGSVISTAGGRTLYGLSRNPDAGGLNYWYNEAKNRYGGVVTTGLKDAFATSALMGGGLDAGRVVQSSKSFLAGSVNGGDFYDRY